MKLEEWGGNSEIVIDKGWVLKLGDGCKVMFWTEIS
jgi:hypothetical protein